MGLIQEADVGMLLHDEKLMDEVVNGLVADTETMDTLADEIANKVQDALGADPELRQRLITAAMSSDAFKQKLVSKLIADLN